MLWEGFPPEFATWEPDSRVHDDLIDAYEGAMDAEAVLEAEEAAMDDEEDMDDEE